MKFLFKLLVWLFLLLVLALLFLPNRYLYHYRLHTIPFFETKVLPKLNNFYRLEDPFRRLAHTFSSSTAAPEPPKLQLHIPEEEQEKLNRKLAQIIEKEINTEEDRLWVNATLTHDGQPYPVQVTWHGKFWRHWRFRQKSMKVRLQDGQQLEGLKKFNLITPDNRDYTGMFLLEEFARHLNLLRPRVRLVQLEINDKNHGTYILEEPVNSKFLKQHGHLQATELAERAAWSENFPDERMWPLSGSGFGFNRGAHISELSPEPAFQEVDEDNDSLRKVALGHFYLLQQAVQQQDFDAADSLLDLDYWARFDALRHLFRDQHNTAFDNLTLVFDYQTRRFYPIYRYEGGLWPTEQENGITNAQTFVFNRQALPLWLFVNQRLRPLKLQYLYRLVSDEKLIEGAIKNVQQQYQDAVVYGHNSEFPIRHRQYKTNALAEWLRHNRHVILKSLNYAYLYANALEQPEKLTVELLPESEAALALDTLLLDLQLKQALPATLVLKDASGKILAQQQKVLQPGQNEISADFLKNVPLTARIGPYRDSFGLHKTIYRLELQSAQPLTVKSVKISARNHSTGKPLPASQVFTAIARLR